MFRSTHQCVPEHGVCVCGRSHSVLPKNKNVVEWKRCCLQNIQYGAAVCSHIGALGIFLNRIPPQFCWWQSLNNVLLCTSRSTYKNLFVVVLQGSYGVVKLAYNEDDDKHYVSQSNHFKYQKLLSDLKAEMQSLCSTATVLLWVFIKPLSLYCLDRRALQDLTRAIDFFFLFFKLRASCPQVASVA